MTLYFIIEEDGKMEFAKGPLARRHGSDIDLYITYPISGLDDLKSYTNKGFAGIKLTDEYYKKLFITGLIHKQVDNLIYKIQFDAKDDDRINNDPLVLLDGSKYILFQSVDLWYKVAAANVKFDPSDCDSKEAFNTWVNDGKEIVRENACKYIKNIFNNILSNENIDNIQVKHLYVDNELILEIKGKSLRECLSYLLTINFDHLSMSYLRKDNKIGCFNFMVEHAIRIGPEDIADMDSAACTDIFANELRQSLQYDDDEEDEDNE